MWVLCIVPMLIIHLKWVGVGGDITDFKTIILLRGEVFWGSMHYSSVNYNTV